MLISKKRSDSFPSFPLTLDGIALIRVSSYKYLGVTLTSTLAWSPHITNCCNKARRLMGLLFRRFHEHSNTSVLLKLYLSFIRPHLEYATIVWDPHLKRDIKALESVQKFALRVCMKSWHTGYADVLTAAKFPTLQSRRLLLGLCHMYKIIHGITDFPDAPVDYKEHHYGTRQKVQRHLKVPSCRSSAYLYSFFPNTLSAWNQLPYRDMKECCSLAAFKKSLSAYLASVYV